MEKQNGKGRDHVIFDLRLSIFDFFSPRSSAVIEFEKQTQFADKRIDVKSYTKGNYGYISLCEARKNKASQSQFQVEEGAFCLWHKRLPRPFGPHNDVRFSATLCLSAFVAIAMFEKTKPIY